VWRNIYVETYDAFATLRKNRQQDAASTSKVKRTLVAARLSELPHGQPDSLPEKVAYTGV